MWRLDIMDPLDSRLPYNKDNVSQTPHSKVG
jgi:hypothetical protein